MTPTVETVRLTETVGAEVRGVDVDRLLHDEDLPAWTHDALEANGVLVFRDLHIDDAAQVAFSKRLGRVEILGKGEHPEIFLVTLDPAKNRSAPYLRGTFDWHIDGLTDDIPIMATILSAHGVADVGRRDRVRQHLRRLRRPHRRGEGALRIDPRGRTRSRRRSAGSSPTRHPSRWRCGVAGRRRSSR